MTKLVRHTIVEGFQFEVQGFVEEDRDLAVRLEESFQKDQIFRAMDGFIPDAVTFIPKDEIVNGVPALEDTLVIKVYGDDLDGYWGSTREVNVFNLTNLDWLVQDTESINDFKVISNDQAISGNF
jgi:hypothetical protein